DNYAAGYDGTGDAACETVHDFARWSTQSGPAAEDASLFKSRHPVPSPSWLTIISPSVFTDRKFSGVISGEGSVRSNSASTLSISVTMSIEHSPISTSRDSGWTSAVIAFCSMTLLTRERTRS